MKLSKKIIQILTIPAIIPFFQLNAYAESPDITIDQSFTIYEDGLWHPGKVESKDFYINNNKENGINIDRLYFHLQSSIHWRSGEELDVNSPTFKELAKYSTVTLKHDDDVLFQDKLENLLSENGVKLLKKLNVQSHDKELLNMTIEKDLEMGNDAQALYNVFTIGVSYTLEEGSNDLKDLPQAGVDKEEGSNDLKDLPQTGVDKEEGANNLKNSPQTGVNVATFLVLGSIAIGTGVRLSRRRER